MVRPGRPQNASTGTVRSPFGPAITHCARFAINAHVVSAAGDALQRLPPTLPRPWICVDPINPTDSARPGQSRRSSACSPTTPAGASRPAAAGGRPGAEPQSLVVDRDRHQFRYAFDVDERGRLPHAGPELDE